MTFKLKTLLAIAAVAVAGQAASQVTFYENDNFQGQSFTTQRNINNFERFGFNDRASSVIVMNNRVEVCDDVRFGGQCTVLRPGRYPSFRAMGINDRVSSVESSAITHALMKTAMHHQPTPCMTTVVEVVKASMKRP